MHCSQSSGTRQWHTEEIDMRAGLLRDRVSIETPTDTRDAAGQPVTAWSTLASRWAQVVEMSGDTPLVGGAPLHAITHEVRMRYSPQITARERIRHRGRVLDIDSVIRPETRSDEMICRCRERPAVSE